MDAGTPLPLLNAEVNDLRFAGACTGAPRRSPRSRTNGSGVLRAGTEEFSAVRREPKLQAASRVYM